MAAYIALAVVMVTFHQHPVGSCDEHAAHDAHSCGVKVLETKAGEASAQIGMEFGSTSDQIVSQQCLICQFHGKQLAAGSEAWLATTDAHLLFAAPVPKAVIGDTPCSSARAPPAQII